MPDLVLVVDDESLVRWSLGERLRLAGYEVRDAANARDARALFAAVGNHCRRVVLLDLRLPDADGLALFDELRELHPGWPVIVLSAQTTPELAQSMLGAGALHVGTKPFDLDEIVTQVRRGFAVGAA